jgi:hypothetical protein
MKEANDADRRTVLKTMGVTLVGGTLLTGTASAERGTPPGKAVGRRNEIHIVSRHDHDTGDHLFEFNTREVGPGWTAFEFKNETEHTHFAYLAKLPQAAIDAAGGRDLLEFYVEQVTEPFQGFMDLLLGKEPRHPIVFPEWFADVLPSGGPGLASGGETAVTTVNLEPGEYIVECYVKNDEGEFHSYLGMIDLLTVTSGRFDTPKPEATLELSVSTDGFDVETDVRPGRHTVAVTFEDQTIYDNLIGHDVHLIRLDEGTTAEDVNGWMDWRDAGGLASDGTEPGTFLGGVDTITTPDLLAGTASETAYVHVTLKPGDYAWVAEVPNPASKGLLTAFSVPADRDRGASEIRR